MAENHINTNDIGLQLQFLITKPRSGKTRKTTVRQGPVLGQASAWAMGGSSPGPGQSPVLPFAGCVDGSLLTQLWGRCALLLLCVWGGGRVLCSGGVAGGLLPGPWTITQSSLKLPLVVPACSAVGPACIASFACEWGPIIGRPHPENSYKGPARTLHQSD